MVPVLVLDVVCIGINPSVCSSPQGSGGLRAAAARAKRPEGRMRNTKDEGGSQDGNPQEAAALPPFCKEAHGPVQSVILSAGRGRGEGFTLISVI